MVYACVILIQDAGTDKEMQFIGSWLLTSDAVFQQKGAQRLGHWAGGGTQGLAPPPGHFAGPAPQLAGRAGAARSHLCWLNGYPKTRLKSPYLTFGEQPSAWVNTSSLVKGLHRPPAVSPWLCTAYI